MNNPPVPPLPRGYTLTVDEQGNVRLRYQHNEQPARDTWITSTPELIAHMKLCEYYRAVHPFGVSLVAYGWNSEGAPLPADEGERFEVLNLHTRAIELFTALYGLDDRHGQSPRVRALLQTLRTLLSEYTRLVKVASNREGNKDK